MHDAIVYCGAAATVWNPHFIDVAQDKHLAVVGVEKATARYADAPGLAEFPIVWAAPDDVAEIMVALRRHTADLRVRGVCALREDWVETAALLADWLGTPSIGLRAARVCRDKALQRMYLPEQSPRSATELDGWDVFPAVVKPAHGSAGVGVRQVRDAAELRCFSGVLVEERVDGPEFSVEMLVQHGEVIFAGVTGKRTNEDERNTFVELAHTVPARLTDAERSVLVEAGTTLVRRLGVGDGILHAEYRLDAAGRAVLMEVNARCPGGSIPALYHLATSTRLEQAIVDIAVGDTASYPDCRRVARQVYVTHAPGTLQDVAHPDVKPTWLAAGDRRPEIVPGSPADPPRLHAVMVIKPKGSPLRELNDNGDRAVTFLIDAPSHDHLDACERRATTGLTIRS